jgi:hypothetical protein
MEKTCQPIYSFHHTFIREMKMLSLNWELMECHRELCNSGTAAGNETGVKVE